MARPHLKPTALIIAGGAGTRLWPISTEDRPKQFLPLTGNRSLLRNTFDRMAPLTGADQVWISTNERYRGLTEAELPELSEDQFIYESAKRNTGAAVALALVRLERNRSQETVVIIVPADQAVRKAGTLRRDLGLAARRATRTGEIVTIGIEPTRAETGYGYLRPTEPGQKQGALRAFVEKPGPAQARRYIRSGYLWNAGIFVASLQTLRVAFETCSPEHLRCAEKAIAAWTQGNRTSFRRAYAKNPNVSLDVAVAERFPGIGYVRSDPGWSDLGGWKAIWEVGAEDRRNNVLIGDVDPGDSRESLLIGDGVRLVASGRGQVTVATRNGVISAPLDP